jgi:imidazolonepropionase-like amidohydrolase
MEKVVYTGKLIGQPEEFVSQEKVIVINGGRIVDIKPRAEFKPGADTEVIDWSKWNVMPGLIDCHDHLGFDIGDEEAQAYEPDFVNCLRGVRNAKTILEAGITTLRVVGEKRFMDVYWRKAIEDGWMTGPRLVVAGHAISKTGGHGWYLCQEADGPNGFRKAIRDQKKNGAQLAKIMITGGISTAGSDPTASDLSEEEIIAAIEEAHQCQLKIAAHAHGGTGVRTAIERGLDSIEHGVYLTEEDIVLMAKKGTFLVVTYGVMAQGARFPQVPEFMKKKCAEAAEHYLDTISLARKHGVNVVFGGDTYHADPKLELEALVKADFTAEEALKAGTIQAAKLLDLEGEIGSIEPGKWADLIAIEGDPMADVTAVGSIAAVMKGGQLEYVRADS